MSSNLFPILTHAQLIEKVKTFDAIKYTKTRNYLNGGVSQLSAYITHGVITIDEIVRLSLTRYTIDQAEMWYKELLWREYFVQVHWWKGDAIFADMEEDKTGITKHDLLPEQVITKTFASGWVNQSIMQLETTGYLHNHQRMWLASYMTHWHKLHRSKCADWTYYHFLDGELGSNHLSWQWVQSTFSHKPYFMNEENLTRYGNGAKSHDESKYNVSSLIRGDLLSGVSARKHLPESQNGLSDKVLDIKAKYNFDDCSMFSYGRFTDAIYRGTYEEVETTIFDPKRGSELRNSTDIHHTLVTDLSLLPVAQSRYDGYTILTPWDLHPSKITNPSQTVCILDTQFTARHPWSPKRIQFVQDYCRLYGIEFVQGRIDQIVTQSRGISIYETRNPYYRQAYEHISDRSDVTYHLHHWCSPAVVQGYCKKFFPFWETTKPHLDTL